MAEEGPIDFKALRAKFQEEALLAQSRTRRPAVAEKPRYVPPPGGHCSSVVSGMSVAVESKTPVVPRVIFRDGLRASGGKRPNSFPPHLQQTSPFPQLSNRDSTARPVHKERHFPLVFPGFPVKEQKIDPPVVLAHKQEADPGKAAPQTKIKKKGLLLPFKSSKAPKVASEKREEPTYADLTMRPSSAPGELPSVEKDASVHSDQSTVECPPSSPDVSVTPPSSEASVDSDSRFISTLERAKKRFSRRQMFMSTKPKGLRSPDYTSTVKALVLPPTHTERVEPDLPVPSPVCLPHLACISARPFFKVTNSAPKSPLALNLGRDLTELRSVRMFEPHSPSFPPKKLLLDLRSLGSLPAKPQRPPLVDLSLYHQPSVQDLSPGSSQAPADKPESESLSVSNSVSNPVLEAPEFPEFDNSEMEMADDEGAVDIASLELEVLDFVSTDLPVPVHCGVTDFQAFQSDLSASDPTEPTVSSIIQDLNFGSQNLIPLDPASFPEPINLPEFPEPPAAEPWSQGGGEEVAADLLSVSQTDETDLGCAECPSVPEELISHAEVNDNTRPQPSVCQEDSYYEACDNVYEDVENLHKLIRGQNPRKLKVNLRNPYVDKLPMEEACLNKWPRNPWTSGPGDHAHSAQNHFHSKERQSPNTADYKERRKREKHRMEKEKKEQKEREKKENEMKKKFKVTGEEEPLYHAKVTVASKVRKNDLPVKTGDTVSIIRTTNCPKGKWLARDGKHIYGYISLMNVELNIQEMLELGKKAQAAGRGGGNMEGDTISIGSRSSSHPVLTSSFTDDSEEWDCEDETLSPFSESHSLPQQNSSASEMSGSHVGALHTLSDANLEDLHTQTRHEALQKLAIFFQHTKDELVAAEADGVTPTNAEPPDFLSAVEEPPYPEQEVDFTELELLPPPPLYADVF